MREYLVTYLTNIYIKSSNANIANNILKIKQNNTTIALSKLIRLDFLK